MYRGILGGVVEAEGSWSGGVGVVGSGSRTPGGSSTLLRSGSSKRPRTGEGSRSLGAGKDATPETKKRSIAAAAAAALERIPRATGTISQHQLLIRR